MIAGKKPFSDTRHPPAKKGEIFSQIVVGFSPVNNIADFCGFFFVFSVWHPRLVEGKSEVGQYNPFCRWCSGSQSGKFAKRYSAYIYLNASITSDEGEDLCTGRGVGLGTTRSDKSLCEVRRLLHCTFGCQVQIFQQIGEGKIVAEFVYLLWFRDSGKLD